MPSLFHQLFYAQLKRDEKVRVLYETMNSTYAFVIAASKELVPEHASYQVQVDVLEEITKQTIECCYFIRDYFEKTKFGVSSYRSMWSLMPIVSAAVKRMAKSVFTGVDSRVKAYCERFAILKECFDRKLRFETRILATRIFRKVQDVGQSSFADSFRMPRAYVDCEQ